MCAEIVAKFLSKMYANNSTQLKVTLTSKFDFIVSAVVITTISK